ncbi:MAG: YHS domain-containing protein [Armatimonadetes bacterium]|nr:YHS domain-containing protein [Armatimonadota bacterium]NIM23231.1 YHS domain-containing protein [Armatimonadota bacterium]NIM67099.1 YHS domain-containing protein [Armatimonadota bacterium]NIM75626.1 YHS domain-containing protein [Armatimonadota bacterium]NIN05288.1 YHS domain-containing protein [Armatimonadota bacterium]
MLKGILRPRWPMVAVTIVAISLLTGFILAGCGNKTQEVATPEKTEPVMANEQNGWAVCAYDGMIMKKAGMGATAEYQGKTLYFCTEDHKAKFMADPEKYQRTWQAFGDDISFNILPIGEHIVSLEEMGMKMQAPPNTTHHITLCAMGPGDMPVKDLMVKATLTAPNGKVSNFDLPLAQDEKHYAANANLSETGEYQAAVALESNGETETHDFTFVVRE